MPGRRRNPIKTLFKVEQLTPNSLIIIKSGSAMDTPAQMKRLAQELTIKGLGEIGVIRFASLDEFHLLSEENMAKLGWVKKGKENAKPD